MEFEEKSLVKGIGNKGIGIGNTNNHGQQVMNIISISFLFSRAHQGQD